MCYRFRKIILYGICSNRRFSSKIRLHTKEVVAANRSEIHGLPSQSFFLLTNHRSAALEHNPLSKEYKGRKLVGYSMENMFDVVSDVANYNQFLPFCKLSRVTSKSENHMTADLVIGFPPIVESYTSNVTLLRPYLVKAVCNECRLIKHLTTTWKFSPALRNSADTCIIDFYVSFEFRSSLHTQLANFFFNELVRQMEGAFYQEARVRYGNPTINTQILTLSKP